MFHDLLLIVLFAAAAFGCLFMVVAATLVPAAAFPVRSTGRMAAGGDHAQAAARRRDRPLREPRLVLRPGLTPARCRSCSASRGQDDPAVAVVERLRREFPHKTIELVVNAAVHGTNPKVSNLINMSARIAHDIIVHRRRDIRVRPDYLSRIVGALEQRGRRGDGPVLRHLDRQSVVAARRD